jgi:hypothetical protein
MFLSNEKLDELITFCENKISKYESIGLALEELKNVRDRDRHIPVGREVLVINGKAKINSVTCSCGHVTRYKKPLNTIEDFKCPKAGK